jgi:hypothetical protein
MENRDRRASNQGVCIPGENYCQLKIKLDLGFQRGRTEELREKESTKIILSSFNTVEVERKLKKLLKVLA